MDVARLDEEKMQAIQRITGVRMKDVEAFDALLEQHGFVGAMGAWALQHGLDSTAVKQGYALAAANLALLNYMVAQGLLETGKNLGADTKDLRRLFVQMHQNAEVYVLDAEETV